MSRILYKYIDIEGAKYMLGNKNLQFTNASQLNDPFDCHPKLLDYSNVPEYKLQGWIPEKWWEKKEENDALNLRNETWLCSLSKVYDSLLMWTHYCYNHKGICIGLDLDEIKKSNHPTFGSLLDIEVQYQDIIERPSAYNNRILNDAVDTFSYQWRTKAKEWEYEQEVRLIWHNPHPMYARLTPEQDKYPKERNWTEIHHYIPLTGDCFESIYFGVNIEPEVKEKMIRFALKKINPQINLYQMKVDADAFRLQPVKVIKI